MTAPNLLNTTTVTAKSVGSNVTTVTANVVNNGSGSNTLVKVNFLNLSNITGTAASSNVFLAKSGGISYPILSNVSIPGAALLVAWGKDTAVYLEEGDAITANASANSTVVITSSYEIIS
jgi:hypothetical protein